MAAKNKYKAAAKFQSTEVEYDDDERVFILGGNEKRIPRNVLASMIHEANIGYLDFVYDGLSLIAKYQKPAIAMILFLDRYQEMYNRLEQNIINFHRHVPIGDSLVGDIWDLYFMIQHDAVVGFSGLNRLHESFKDGQYKLNSESFNTACKKAAESQLESVGLARKLYLNRRNDDYSAWLPQEDTISSERILDEINDGT